MHKMYRPWPNGRLRTPREVLLACNGTSVPPRNYCPILRPLPQTKANHWDISQLVAH